MSAEYLGDLAAKAALNDDVAQKLRIDALQQNLSGGGKTKDAKLREACQGFESVFLSKMFAQMRATVPKDGMLHGQYEEQYYSMFDKELCDKLSRDGGFGLADMMYRQLKGQVLGKGKDGKAEAGDILPPNRPVGVHQSTTSPDGRLPVAAGGMPRGPRNLSGVQRFSLPAGGLGAAGRRGDGAALASAHDAGATELAEAASQAATPMAAPVSGTITSEFGWRSDPFKKKAAWHAGMDIAAAEGDSVAACWDGKVVFAGVKGGYGNVVEIEHPGGWKSVYGHLRTFSAKSGDAVAAGEKIAEVGSTGRSTGPHLHFELRRGGDTVDPEGMLAAAGMLHGPM